MSRVKKYSGNQGRGNDVIIFQSKHLQISSKQKITTFKVKYDHLKYYQHTQIICLNLRLHNNKLYSYKTPLVK